MTELIKTSGSDSASYISDLYEAEGIDEVNKTLEILDGRSSSKLVYNGDGTWTSKEGLIYGQGSKQGNRVLHVLEHTKPNASKTTHTIFNVDKSEVIGLIDEAWFNRGSGNLQSNGNVMYQINMKRVIGTNGEDTIIIITKGYTKEIITAYPKAK